VILGVKNELKYLILLYFIKLMSKKEYKKLDPSLINFTLVPKENIRTFTHRNRQPRNDYSSSEFKFDRSQRGASVEAASTIVSTIPTMRVVRGDLAHVNPKRDLDFYVKQSVPRRYSNQNLLRQQGEPRQVDSRQVDSRQGESRQADARSNRNLGSEFRFHKGSNYQKSEPGDKPVAKPVAKPVSTPIIKPIEKPIEKPVAKPVAKRPESSFLNGLVPFVKEIEKEELKKSSISKIEVSPANDVGEDHNSDIYKQICQVKGTELLQTIDCIDEAVSPTYFVQHICEIVDDFESLQWIDDSEYGAALRYLLLNDYEKQKNILCPLLAQLNKLKFPQNLIVLLFKKLIDSNIVHKTVILDWYDSPKDFDGWKKAVLQTSEWILQLVDEEDEEESDDDMY
jgi:hypothetical protein